MSDLDGQEEILQSFLEEAYDIINNSLNKIELLKNKTDEQDSVQTIARDLHTLKGAARVVNQLYIATIAHELEYLFEIICNFHIEITPALLEHIIKIYDKLLELLDALKNNVNQSDALDIIDLLEIIMQYCTENYTQQRNIDSISLNEFQAFITPVLTKLKNNFDAVHNNLQREHIPALEELIQTIKEEAIAINDLNLCYMAHTIDLFCLFLSISNFFDKTATPILAQAIAQLARHITNLNTNNINTITDFSLKDEINNYKNKAFSNNNKIQEITTSSNKQEDLIRVKASTLEKLALLIEESGINIVNLSQNINFLKDFNIALKAQLDKIVSDLNNNTNLTVIKDNLKVMKSLLDVTVDANNITSKVEVLLRNEVSINHEFQANLLQTRLIPFSTILPRLRVLVSQLSKELNKEVNFIIKAKYENIEYTILNKLTPALEHLIRNSLDHGIETKEDRILLNKTPKASIALQVYQFGSNLHIEISDDGSGIDRDKIIKKALYLGLIKPENNITDEQLQRLILLPGFSTKSKTTEISGRGVGLDVVNHTIRELGGALTIESEPKVGTKFAMKIPFTFGLKHALIVKIRDDAFALQLDNITAITRLTKDLLPYYFNISNPVFNYLNQQYEIIYLGSPLGIVHNLERLMLKKSAPLLLIRIEDVSFALLVDEIMGTRDIAIKTLDSRFQRFKILQGATITANGRVILALDLADLAINIKKRQTPVANFSPNKLILLADDSLTNRQATAHVLQQNGYNIIMARDGMEAKLLLENHSPDLLILDIEMPRLNGIELIQEVAKNPRLNNIPVIFISSLLENEYRTKISYEKIVKCFQKPYDYTALLSTINNVMQIG